MFTFIFTLVLGITIGVIAHYLCFAFGTKQTHGPAVDVELRVQPADAIYEEPDIVKKTDNIETSTNVSYGPVSRAVTLVRTGH